MEIRTTCASGVAVPIGGRSQTLMGVLAGCLLLGAVSGCATLKKRRLNTDAVTAREMTRLGQSAMDNRRWREAETRFTHALELSPDDVTARRHYAQTLWQLGRRDAAIEHLKAAVAQSGGDPNWIVELGIMLLAENQLDGAIASADEALEIDNRNAAAWLLRADVLQRQGYHDEALSHYHRARSLGSTEPRVLANIAAIYQRQGRPHRMLTTLQRLQDDIGITQIDTRTLRLLGLAFRGVGRFDEAVETLTLAYQRNPRDGELLAELAETQYEAGHLEVARSSAAAALRMGSANEHIRTLLARIDTADEGTVNGWIR